MNEEYKNENITDNGNFKTQTISIIVFPILLSVPITLKLISARIFLNFEFRTQTFRLLKYISFIDALSTFILMLMPFEEFLRNKTYCLSVFRLIVIIFIGRSLVTFSSILSLNMAWNQFRDLKNYKITGRWFYLILVISIVFSLILHSPNIILKQSSFKNCSNNQSSNIIRVNQNSHFELFTIIQSSISYSIIVASLSLSCFIAHKMKKQKLSKSKSIIFISNKKRSSKVFKISEYRPSMQNSTSVKSLEDEIVLPTVHIRRNSQFYETETKQLSTFIVLILSVDQVLKVSFDLISLFIQTNSEKPNYYLMFFLTILVFCQTLHILIYIKFCDPFSKRFYNVFKNCHF